MSENFSYGLEKSVLRHLNFELQLPVPGKNVFFESLLLLCDNIFV